MVLLPENKNNNYDQSMNKEQNNDQLPNLLTDDELPNSEEGEIINEIGLLNINNVQDQTDSFSI